MSAAPTLILASTSPRRYQILSLLDLPFLMIPPGLPEVIADARSPEAEVLYQADLKARSLADRFPETVIIGSDTLIDFNGRKIGKPRDAADARTILRTLRGRPHHVVTAVVILTAGASGRYESLESVRVTMAPFSDAVMDAYVESGDPLDKAGAYSLQGAGRSLISDLSGDYLAAVGLPLKAVAVGLESLGVAIPRNVTALYSNREFLNWKTFG